MELCDALKKLREEIPAVFAGTEMDRLTGKGMRWRTFQNQMSRGEIPEGVVIKSGRKNLIVRDSFLAHWQTKLQQDIREVR